MGLKKEIELESGIIVSYHRIVNIQKITNSATVIEVASYISEKKRQEEVEYYKQKAVEETIDLEGNLVEQEIENNKSMNVFIHTTFINKKYNDLETISDLYDFLKTTEMFKNAENS